MGSSALAADQVTSPNPAAETTYQLYLDGVQFGQVVVNTTTHKCTAEVAFEQRASSCSVGSAERRISGRLHLVEGVFNARITVQFTVHRGSGSAAYSGLGLAFYRESGKTVAELLSVQLKS